MINKQNLFCWLIVLCVPLIPHIASSQVYFTNGLKIQEVTDTSAVIWTRLCKHPKPVAIWHKQKDAPFRTPIDFDNYMPVNQMDGAVEGTFGEVRITLTTQDRVTTTDWKYVSVYKDFTLMEVINGLKPNTVYHVLLEGRKKKDSVITEIKGHFKTAPSSKTIIPVGFTSSTCQYFWDYDDPIRGFKAYDAMLKLNPDFHCQTGDYVYYDKPGPLSFNIELARHKWHAINAWPSLVDFYSSIPSFLQKDDHDILKDDASPDSEPFGELTFEDALSIWHEQVPLNGKPFRTIRWGKDLEVWLVEAREFRSDNNIDDGENKSIFGKEQKAWLQASIESSDATFKILMSPTPVVGPDRVKGKNDNHSNDSYKTEGSWLRRFLSTQKNMFVVNGDRHWQYVSKDLETGLLEFSQGATSDEHAQGWNPDDYRPEHEFLRVKGGFLYVSVYREDNIPTINFRHYDVDGNVVHEKIIR
ncbi:alkaline phosphatase [Pseudalgibacter alginicilyticus]|uniref:Alkaline phosphatase n=1 Tax=Pseudalgibacter alginicilyticus TaxID=1736674 RepID=A0A0P0D387_9FLAO|nr:alkaline phosphatase D family protein [Pseudalgibacter alginicilyticus]ALJ05404.1 alkaline phosphatase [Pseudalgibacter alginicilyticus]